MWRRLGMAAAVGLWILASVSSVGAQVPREEPRLALVIGNSAYRESPLRNPVNDVRAMAQRLRELGFTVLAHENATKRTMEAAIIEFGRRLAEGGVGAFYYAGHGLQVRGRNYLVPVDAEIEDEASTRVAAVDVELLLEQMGEAKNRVNIVILDACRNNPFERRMRGASRGLAAVDAARGTLVAYATAPGSVAADGDGKNGLYTEELLEALREPGLKIEEVFKRVRINVARRSKGAQTPWESSSLTGDLVVNVTVNVTTAAVSPAPAPDREGLFWMSIKDGTDPAAFDAYLKQYPQGTFAALARQRLASVSQPARVPDLARFDGAWNVTVQCPAHGSASAYTRRLLAQVKDGALAAQLGDVGQPGFLTLSGKIQPDGKASIDARGMVGDPKNTANRLGQGTAFAYRVDAVFEGARGVGNRTDDAARPCSLTFVK
ncbi:MAG TPA: caspase family protein [Candidatus Udaeobacter sp.]|nr:caspase family protein [Candidatus Udaeobacter sp.]